MRLCVCEQSARIVDKEGTLAIGGFLIGDVSDFCCYFYILLLLLRLKGKNKQQIQQQLQSLFNAKNIKEFLMGI